MNDDHVWDYMVRSTICKVQELGHYLWLGYLDSYSLNLLHGEEKYHCVMLIIGRDIDETWLLYYILEMLVMGHAINIENDA